MTIIRKCLFSPDWSHAFVSRLTLSTHVPWAPCLSHFALSSQNSFSRPPLSSLFASRMARISPSGILPSSHQMPHGRNNNVQGRISPVDATTMYKEGWACVATSPQTAVSGCFRRCWMLQGNHWCASICCKRGLLLRGANNRRCYEADAQCCLCEVQRSSRACERNKITQVASNQTAEKPADFNTPIAGWQLALAIINING